MKEIKAPNKLECDEQKSIFLAGSIEMGVAENWQARIVKALKDCNITIFNPRRAGWDSSWAQTIDNPQFRQQVEWELDAMTRADLIAMEFDPKTKSPITLLELGLFSRYDILEEKRKIIVYCPEGFWRKGNVDIVCRRYGIDQVVNEIDLILTIKQRLNL